MGSSTQGSDGGLCALTAGLWCLYYQPLPDQPRSHLSATNKTPQESSLSQVAPFDLVLLKAIPLSSIATNFRLQPGVPCQTAPGYRNRPLPAAERLTKRCQTWHGWPPLVETGLPIERLSTLVVQGFPCPCRHSNLCQLECYRWLRHIAASFRYAGNESRSHQSRRTG